MEELTTNPFFQSGILPFTTALIIGLMLRPLGWYWSGLGLAVAYLVAIYFITGYQLTPLTSTRKIFLLAGTAVVLGLIIDALPKKWQRYLPCLIAITAAAASVWIIWPLLKRLDGQEYWLMIAASVGFAAWSITLTESLRDQSYRAVSTAFCFGLGLSISAMLGASALLGQLAGVMAAAAGAYLLLLLFKVPISVGSNFSFTAATFAALIGISAVTYADLAWYALIPLALIPLAARLPVKESWHPSLKTIVTTLYPLPLALISIYITWQMDTGGDSLY